MKISSILNPPVIFLENVANLVNHDNGRTFKIIKSELEKQNYIVKHAIIDACNYNIPQHRTRTYITAFKSSKHASMFKFPSQTGSRVKIFDIIDRTTKINASYYEPTNSSYFKALSVAIKDNNQIYRFSDYGIQSSVNGISFTLKANMGTWPNRVPYIKDEFGIRKITPEECLSLQGFPREFVFPSIPEKSKYKQCGNTVCVPVVQMIASELFNVMIENPHSST